jgi:hypothetical protein
MCNHSLVIIENIETESKNRSPLSTEGTNTRSAIAREDGLEGSFKANKE